MNNQPEKHYVYIDILRIISIIGIISLHCSATLVESFSSLGIFTWLIAVFFNTLGRFGVNIFFILAGALALTKNYSNWSSFYCKKFFRLVIPFVFWSIFYYFFTKITNLETGHLWFLRILIILEFLTPMLQSSLNKLTKKQISTIILILLILIFVSWLGKIINFSLFISDNLIGGLTLYLIGFYLQKFTTQINWKTCMFFLIIIFLINNIGTFVMYFFFNQLQNFWFYPIAITNIFGAIILYLFIRDYFNNKELSPAWENNIHQFGQNTFGVYLIHIWIMFLLTRIVWDYNFIHLSIFSLTVFIKLIIMTAGTYFISNYLVNFLKSIPILKMAFGEKESIPFIFKSKSLK